jgi:two-component system sensor histidine kinase KdpD
MSDERPDPDRLLRALRREAGKPAGRLKVFLGAAAGVGKTFAMLDAAREARAAGRDVVVGVVVTHGREETVARLRGVECVPLRPSEREGVPPELDVDAVLARRPDVVIVDELAHTNAPGGRHPKRWQDVRELVEGGLEVWTAVNVQHLESVNDVVARITGVDVRETVPDRLLDEADEVEVIDLTPEDLIARMEAGKVYAPDQARRALSGFFKAGNLTALRQLALRRAAHRVGQQLDSLREREAVTKVWAAAERLLVAVGPSPLSGRLVRAASRMARSLDVPWHAVSVHPMRGADQAQQAASLQHLRLAEQLGAETAVVTSDQIAVALLDYARSVNATMLVLGAPTRRSWRERLFGSLLDAVIRRADGLEVHVIASEAQAGVARPVAAGPKQRRRELLHPLDVGLACLTAATATAVGWALRPHISESDVIMLYVAAVTVAAFRVRLAAGLVSALFSALAFNFFFTEPLFTFLVDDSRYLLTFVLIGGVGALVATLAARLKEHARAVGTREAQAQELFRLTRRLAACKTEHDVAEVAADQIHRLFAIPSCVLLPADGELRLVARRGVMDQDEVEQVTARWCADHGVPAGRGTATLPGSAGRYLPLGHEREVHGVLGVRPSDERRLDQPDQQHMLETVVTLVGEFLDRVRLESRAAQSRLQAETEKVRSTLLSSVSHDLRTPLATLTGAATTLLDPQAQLSAQTRYELLARIASEARRLERLLENVLHMTRLDGAAIRPNLEWEIPDEIVAAAVARVAPLTGGRAVRVRGLEGPLLARIDPVLIEQLVTNLLENALVHAPGDTPIDVQVRAPDDTIVLEVADRGPGLGALDPERVFDKFVRGPGPSSNGVGLGLAICKAIAQVHGGRVWVRARDGGGAVFGATLPRGGPDGERAPSFEEDLALRESP